MLRSLGAWLTCALVFTPFAAMSLGTRDVAAASAGIAGVQQVLPKVEDVDVRRRRVLELVAAGTQDAAGKLHTVARKDADVQVRVDAARGLGRIEYDATELIVDLIQRGGPMAVRDALASALAKRGAPPEDLVALAQDPKRPILRRGLAIEALGAFDGEFAAAVLERAALDRDPFVRTSALRALGRHPDGAELLGPALTEALTTYPDSETILTSLDVAVDIASPRFEPVVDLLDSLSSIRTARAVAAARARFEYAQALDRFEKEQVGPYGSKTPPEEPPGRARHDVVYILDATGSVTSHMHKFRSRVETEARLLQRVGTDVRVGVVAYRDNERRQSEWKFRAQPLTYDLGAVDVFFSDLDARGTDARGTPVHRGLAAAMERMNWRRNARRQVVLLADGRANDPRAAKAIARLHRAADGITLHVFYLLRTRVKIPQGIIELAEAGGGAVEPIE